jgi:translation elongation factor EF-G
LWGLDQHILRDATLLDAQDTTSQPLKMMRNAQHSIRATVTPSDASKLPRLVEGLKSLVKSSNVISMVSESGEYIVEAPSYMAAGNFNLKYV